MKIKYKCEFCNKEYDTKKVLYCHYSVKHKNDKHNTKCHYCGHDCSRLAALTNHLKLCILNPENNNKERKFKCCWCNESFITKTQLRNHKHDIHPEYSGHSWNKGLNKNNSDLVNKIANNISNTAKNKRELSINEKGLIKNKIKYKKFKTNFTIRYCKTCGVQLNFKNKSGYCKKHVQMISNANPEKREKIRLALLKHVADGTHKGWKSRNIKSYAEIFFEKVLNNNKIKYIREKKVGKYFLDFVIGNIDLEIDGKQHEYKDRQESDLQRDNFLRNQGYFVYRIKWNEINSDNGKEMMKNKIDLFLDFLEYFNNCI